MLQNNRQIVNLELATIPKTFLRWEKSFDVKTYFKTKDQFNVISSLHIFRQGTSARPNHDLGFFVVFVNHLIVK